MYGIKYRMIVPALALLTIIAGCAGKKTPPALAPLAVESIITIEAGSYSFKPSAINVQGPGSFTLQVINTTGSENNLTLKDPSDKVIKVVNISPRGTSISIIDLPDPGVYAFYSDKKLRASLGTKGRIIVGGAQSK